jgi:hypothetical protein
MKLNTGTIPIIKENRWNRIVEVLAILDRFPYNREKQKTLVIELYDGKSEKSVFRGMVIPTLRHLGLVLGRGPTIRLSANGKLVALARTRGEHELSRVSAAVVEEIDRLRFGFLDALKQLGHQSQVLSKDQFVEKLVSLSRQIPAGRARERIRRWTELLLEVELFRKEKAVLLINSHALKILAEERRMMDSSAFEKILLKAYKMLALRAAGPVVDIAAMREKTAILAYDDCGRVLTEAQFDELLTQLLSASHEYGIWMGRPTAPREKSFAYGNNFYRTIAMSSGKVHM